MTTFKDFLQWFNNKDGVTTLEAMQKMVQFYHQKEIDMLKLGCPLPNLVNIFLQKSTNKKLYPFCESDRDLCEQIREDMTGGPSIVFTRKAVVDETFIPDSSNVCKSIVGIDASQLYPYSMCQDMPTGLYTRWEFDSDMQKFKARHNRSRSWSCLTTRSWSCLTNKKPDQNAELRASTHLEIKRKLTVSMLMDIAITAKQCLKQWDAITIFVLNRRLVPHLAMKILREETKGERWMT